MSPTVRIDEIDVKILHALIKDARAELKGIAKSCGVSVTAISNRVKRLRATNVITGAAQFMNMARLGYLHPASIGIKLNLSQEFHTIKIIKEQARVVSLSRSVGKNDLSIFLVAKSIEEIDNLKQAIRRQVGLSRITINIWDTPHLNLENVDIQPTRA